MNMSIIIKYKSNLLDKKLPHISSHYKDHRYIYLYRLSCYQYLASYLLFSSHLHYLSSLKLNLSSPMPSTAMKNGPNISPRLHMSTLVHWSNMSFLQFSSLWLTSKYTRHLKHHQKEQKCSYPRFFFISNW